MTRKTTESYGKHTNRTQTERMFKSEEISRRELSPCQPAIFFWQDGQTRQWNRANWRAGRGARRIHRSNPRPAECLSFLHQIIPLADAFCHCFCKCSQALELLPSVRCSFFDQRCNLLRPWRRRPSGWHPQLRPYGCWLAWRTAFEVGVDGSVASGYQHPAWFSSPSRRGDDRFEIVSSVQHLRPRHERGLLGRQVGCEVLMKLRRVEVSETVRRLLCRTGLAEIAWEALSVVSLILSSIPACGPRCTPNGRQMGPSPPR
jgi:hypothetical protein